jgi:hypothetical protein
MIATIRTTFARLLALAAVVVLGVLSAGAAERPNIILVMTDDK